jgi:hypothetical protein
VALTESRTIQFLNSEMCTLLAVFLTSFLQYDHFIYLHSVAVGSLLFLLVETEHLHTLV